MMMTTVTGRMVVGCDDDLVGTMRPLGQDGAPKVHNMFSKFCGVRKRQLCLSVDDTRLSLAALPPDMVGSCANPAGYKEGI